MFPRLRSTLRKTYPGEDAPVRIRPCPAPRSLQIGAAFYFLDGLDEAPPDVQFDLLEKLSTLNVKIFIISRPLPNLDACFPGAHRFSIRAEDRDLELHIAEEIARSPVLQSILNQGGPTLRERIALTIKEKCGGMFLHASLQLDALRDCTNVYDVEKTLEDFPPRIEDVYQQTWSRILAQTPKVVALAENVLVWVLCATRSLGIEELCRAVAICPDTHKFDPNRLVDEATLMALCRGLVNIEDGTNIVRFVHYTAKDVVKRLISESSPYPDSLPAAFCMALLAERGFQQNIHDEDAFNAALNDESLLEYAYTNWSAHAHKSLDDSTVASRLSHFIQGCYAFPVRLHLFGYEILEPLHMAAYFDFPLSIAGSAHLRNPNHPTPYRGRTPLIRHAF
ncbi:hypothetical protein BKA70DRAFT_346645 [Coprinopsis sp. MPI-PUGE-AT-0042]|nr:hypothetical protein BKA70DRAFT_346645 [Coprinopsis sp. MPI-PUGE-AT-0042]